MRTRLLSILAGLMGLLLIIYFYPVPHPLFEQIYQQVEPQTVQALLQFRQSHPIKSIQSHGKNWEYFVSGQGENTIVFLHGMTGSADIWWRVISALETKYRIVAVTYPAADSLSDMQSGLLAILDAEGVQQFNLVGTSLGGYFAQYLTAQMPERIEHAVFANTFPPNDLIAENNKTIGAVLPFLPEWLVMSVFRDSFSTSIYPASGDDELTLAMLNEIGYGRVSKAQVVARYRCVIEKFSAVPPVMPVMLFETSNDPLVEAVLREQLKMTYPNAEVHTLGTVGHFPYINHPDVYVSLLSSFFEK